MKPRGFGSCISWTACILLIFSACAPDPISTISYPPAGAYGDNILLPTKMTYGSRTNSLTAVLPKDKKVKIVITGKTVSAASRLYGVWYYAVGTQNNWALGSFDASAFTQQFTSVNGGVASDLKMDFDNGTYQIDYFENGATIASASKTIVVNY